MDLYCIKTHPDRVVVRGRIYPFISDKAPCNCKDAVNVGVKCNQYEDDTPLNKGDYCICPHCNVEHIHDGYWWLAKNRFIPIDEINIEEAIECINENNLAETL